MDERKGGKIEMKKRKSSWRNIGKGKEDRDGRKEDK